MLCIFLNILAGRKGIKSPLITAEALFWWGMCLSSWAPLVLPWVREAEVEIQVKLLRVRNQTKLVFQEVILI